MRLLARLWLALSLILVPLAPGQAALGGHSAPAHPGASVAHHCAHHGHLASPSETAHVAAPCCCDNGCEGKGKGHCQCDSFGHGVVALPSVRSTAAATEHVAPIALLPRFTDSTSPPEYRPPII